MTKVKYNVTIHISRSNTTRLVKDDLTYPKKPVAAESDNINFLQQKIVIKATRNSKRLGLEDILEYKQSTIYSQILKALLYLYLGNGKRIGVRSIEVTANTLRESRVIEKNSQPLPNDFHIAKPIPAATLNRLWEESAIGEILRTVATHYLTGLSSKDRYFKFERLWRAFEQLAYWHYYHRPLPKSPNSTEAMKKMRQLILTKPAYLTDTFSLVGMFNSRQLFKLHWRKQIEYGYPYTGKLNQLIVLRDNLLADNQDVRLCRIFEKAKDMRKTALDDKGLTASFESIIAGYKASRIQRNDHVLALLLCKYGFFMRNKMFHGQEADFAFCFTNHTEDDDITDFMNALLESTITDMLCGYDSL